MWVGKPFLFILVSHFLQIKNELLWNVDVSIILMVLDAFQRDGHYVLRCCHLKQSVPFEGCHRL